MLTDVLGGAIQNRFVRTAVLTDVHQRLDYPQPKLLSLLLLVNHNILDMTRTAQSPLELALHEYRSHSYNHVGRLVNNDKRVVYSWRGTQRLEVRNPSFLSWIWRIS